MAGETDAIESADYEGAPGATTWERRIPLFWKKKILENLTYWGVNFRYANENLRPNVPSFQGLLECGVHVSRATPTHLYL